MDFMAFMETMGTGNIPIVAAFFIGLMMSVSPCPLATNIAAIGYMSRKVGDSRYTLLIGLFYSLGRMVSYVAVASLIVYLGLNMQSLSFFLQNSGEILLGPLMIIIGLFVLEVINLDFWSGSSHLSSISKKVAEKGLFGSFLLGVIFALSFCPFSAVLFFAMLIPLALKTGDAILIPAVFAFATAIPVIIFSVIMVTGISRLGIVMKKAELFDLWMRRAAGLLFIVIGVYYLFGLFF